MKLGIVGLPNVGKSTIFNAITKAGAAAENYPFCTIEPNVGVVTVPDHRIDVLHKMYNSKKTVYTAIEFYDIAGLVKGASKGEGLGNKFLGHIREVAAILHVVRCFDDDNVVHVSGKPDPMMDIETINLELILSDMEVIDRRLQKSEKAKKADPTLAFENEILKKIQSVLEAGNSARIMTNELSKDEEDFVRSLDLLSFKPVIYMANVSEKELSEPDNPWVTLVKTYAEKEASHVVVICAKVEAELAELDTEERNLFLQELGIKESGLEKLIKVSYSVLDLISFLTAGEPEVRAWTIKRGSKAPQAAGKIHTDFEKGFIRAETVAYEKLMECGGNLVQAKEKGLVKSEGKEYIVKDGDIIHFLFNV